mgnify:CR=1 FL=1
MVKIWCMIKQENALFSYILYNDDFINKEEVSLTSEPRNPEIAICQTLDAPDLVEAYEKRPAKRKVEGDRRKLE